MMPIKPRLALLCALLCACAKKPDSAAGDDPDPVVYVKSEDPGMTAAIAKAQATLGDFKLALQDPKPNTERYAVKVGFPYGKDNREHIWLKEPEFKAASVSGRVMNAPVDVPDLKFGQLTTAPVADVSDWMYVEGGVMRGGYTMRVLLDKMSPEEKQKMLAQLGVKLD